MTAARHTRTRRTALASALCAVVALGATACGPFSDDAKASGPFGDLSGTQIADRAITATKKADSLTLDLATKTTDGPMKAYLAMDTRGKCAGTLTVGTTGTAELIKADDKDVYLRFDEAFLRAQAEGEPAEVQEAVLKELKGRWVKTPVTDPDAKDNLELCDLTALLGEFEAGTAFAVKGKETTVGGRKALTLTEKAGGETTTVYVATEGEPYILKIVSAGGEEPGTMTFTDYGKPVEAKVPAKKDVVDEEKTG
ncbi:hypothetical protein M5362_25560 [Streptomyces sp. Je 1-79]|uniref:hypothetical protein n=1 Tax=Streptomyces sp. Je 1-79 TaxID=2943847 RepID=UPI0021A5BFB5|nr:hypothetical protein [Streptomyces sp. Je 1-79]MCT4356501.1 hypothetical protein [Streptomyces sp. Je 1-79]